MTDSTQATAALEGDTGGDTGVPPARRPARRRARGLRTALAVTLMAAVVPGAGLGWSGRRAGYLITLLALAGGTALAVHFRSLDAVVDLAVDPTRLRVAAVLIAAVLLLWAVTVVASYVAVRPLGMSRWKEALGALFVAALCLVLASPLALASRYATVQAGLVTDVFQGNATATVPLDVSVEDPWGGRERVSILLLGGDGDVGRDGIRTDTVILASIDTRTGDTVLFSLPRNLMNAQFPADSPLHELYPEGFQGYGEDPAAWMLNAVYGQVPALHPGILGGSDNEGADAVKQAVEGSLGTPVDYYMLVNLDGFKQIVDAMGGVTVDINEPVAIQGDTDRGIPPIDYLQPGPDQRLDGYEALWFTRGRWGSDDYERMLRQRCMINALIDEARPLNLLRRYQGLVAAGKEIVRTDVPSRLLSAFVDLSLRVKDAEVSSLAFVASDRFAPADPDFEWMRAAVQRALTPVPPHDGGQEERPGPGTGTEEPGPSTSPSPGSEEPDAAGTVVSVAESCEYQPAS